MANDEIAAYGQQLMDQTIKIREDEAHKARRVVAGKSKNKDDATELLDALGLL